MTKKVASFPLTNRGRELAERLNRESIIEKMPKIYYVEDFSADRYRVGRTDWPGDRFELISRKRFDIFKSVYQRLNMPLIDKTFDDDTSSE